MLDTIEQVLHQHVQDVKRVILCRSLQLVAKRQKRGNPTLSGYSRDRLSFRGGRVASQNLQSSSGQAREIDATRAERTHFDESVHRKPSFVPPITRWRRI